jgi:CheY-like chemotaxis protein
MKTILLVEDDYMVRIVTMHTLQHAGYRVVEAASGEDALEVWKRQGDTIDLVFTDLEMPGLNGADVAEILEKKRPGLKVLFTSGFGNEYVQKRLGHRMPCPFLAKPVGVRELIAAVREQLEAGSPPPGTQIDPPQERI